MKNSKLVAVVEVCVVAVILLLILSKSVNKIAWHGTEYQYNDYNDTYSVLFINGENDAVVKVEALSLDMAYDLSMSTLYMPALLESGDKVSYKDANLCVSAIK